MHAKVNKITQEICDAVAVSVGSDGDGRLPNRDGVCTLRTASVWCGGGGPTEKQKASGQMKRVQVHEIPSMTKLPPSNTRWVASRKVAVVAAVSNGMVTLEEACTAIRCRKRSSSHGVAHSRILAFAPCTLAALSCI